jgi:nitroreductase
MVELEEAIRARRSIRLFHPDKPVPRELVVEALELAIRAPSNSNTQPWHLVLTSRAARDRLAANLMRDARRREPKITPGARQILGTRDGNLRQRGYSHRQVTMPTGCAMAAPERA